MFSAKYNSRGIAAAAFAVVVVVDVIVIVVVTPSLEVNAITVQSNLFLFHACSDTSHHRIFRRLSLSISI